MRNDDGIRFKLKRRRVEKILDKSYDQGRFCSIALNSKDRLTLKRIIFSVCIA